MTRIEWMRQASEEDIARVMCDNVTDCIWCEVSDQCDQDENGFLRWLEEEMDGSD